MFFVTIFLVILAVVFMIWGSRSESHETFYLGVCFLLAAVGTGIIEFFALTAV